MYTILVVDDSPFIVDVIVTMLERGGYRTVAAYGGEECLEILKTVTPDLILLDIMMEPVDGWETLERIKENPDTKEIPVLMLTARDATQDRVRGLDTGADDYLVKPFDLSELLARLRALIRRSARQARPSVEVRDLVIDPRSRTVTRARQPVPLTAREYAILEYLVLHRGEVVTRTALYEHLFDENDDTLSNLLDVHVFNIRRKLGPDLITTRRGQGYCIE